MVLGDGCWDSPGDSAKYGTYSLMDAEQNIILDSQLVQICTKLNLNAFTIFKFFIEFSYRSVAANN